MCMNVNLENGQTPSDLVRVGVDSNLKIHVQYTTRNGWVVRMEYIPPSDAMSKISSITGQIADGDIVELHDNQRDAVMEMLF